MGGDGRLSSSGGRDCLGRRCLLFANTYDLDNNLLATSNLPQPLYNDLAIYTYLRGLENDWRVLQLAHCVGVDGGHWGWQPGTLPKDFDFKVKMFLLL